MLLVLIRQRLSWTVASPALQWRLPRSIRRSSHVQALI
jgi:hypothetical protein